MNKMIKKIAALFLAGALAATAVMPAFAETVTAGVDASVSVEGLLEGDKISLYQVLTWNDATNDFVLAEGFTGLTFSDGQEASAVVAAIKDGITQAEANAIATYTKTATAKGSGIIDATKKYTYTLPTGTDGKTLHSGLGVYVGVITAGSPKYVYNPVFVSADFVTDNSTGVINASTATYNTAVAKRKEITVTKTTSDSNEKIKEAINSYVGEPVDFQVKTTIPVFMDSYKNPSFVIDDVIKTSGIELTTGSIKVTLGSTQYTDYEVTDTFKVVESGTTGYTVTFDAKYLKANTVPVDVTIDYKGKITNTAQFNVNEDTNEVTVTYANGPNNEKGALRDRTNHYTFSLGADVFGAGSESGKTFELVKVGVDADGKPVVEKKQVSSWSKNEDRHPLKGATFGLFTDQGCATPYKNDLYPNGAEFTTLADGVITFKGLAAGVYYLKEISAPEGYIADTRVTKIEIVAAYDQVTVPATVENDIPVAEYTVDVLKSYTVKVNNVSVYNGTTDTYEQYNGVRENVYTYNNDGKNITTITGPDKELDSDLINTVGVELPSTGGMGTTIFYVIGGLLVLAAAIILISRRRVQQ